MTEPAQHREPRDVGPPDGKVIGAIEPTAVGVVIVALAGAGFPADQIDVVTAADLETIGGPFEQDGLRGFIERFLLSLGEELTAGEELRRMASAGHTLIGVPVEGDEAMHRAAKVLRDHGAHEVTHFGRWTITTL